MEWQSGRKRKSPGADVTAAMARGDGQRQREQDGLARASHDRVHRLVFVTDVHLTEGIESEARFARDLAEIRALTPRPDLLVFGGDVCLWSAGAATAFLDLLHDYPIPQMHAMGNHDTTLEVPAAECGRDFEALLAPVSDCRRLGGAHVITLNTCAMDPAHLGSRNWHNVLGWVPDADLSRLGRTLHHIEDLEAPLLVFVHIPLFSTFPQRMNAGQAERDVWLVGNRQRVVELLRPFARCTVAQGHLHENEQLEAEGIQFVSVGAIAGAWWSRLGFAECPDGSPRGYLVADIEGREVRLDYRAAGCTPDYRACVFAHEGGRYLNVFYADAREQMEVRMGEGWRTLERETGLVMRERWTSAHVWKLPAGAPDGPVSVRTRRNGREIRLNRVPFLDQYMEDAGDRSVDLT